MARLSSMVVLILSMGLLSCDSTDDSTGPKILPGLRPGLYHVSFEIPVSSFTPGGLIGDHDFSFRVVEPITDASSFTLESSTHTSRLFNGSPGTTTVNYLSPSTSNGLIAASAFWRIQWQYQDISSLGVRVTMTEEDDGPFGLPFGCNAIRSEIESWTGFNCSVDRVN